MDPHLNNSWLLKWGFFFVFIRCCIVVSVVPPSPPLLMNSVCNGTANAPYYQRKLQCPCSDKLPTEHNTTFALLPEEMINKWFFLCILARETKDKPCFKLPFSPQHGGGLEKYVDSMSRDVSEEMKKHADNLTPSHFGEANDSMINRKQRHRKQCEMRDGSGVYQSRWARWKHTGSHDQLAHTLPCWWSGFIHEIQVNSSIPTIIRPAFLQSMLCDCVFPKVIRKEKCPLPAPAFPAESNCQIVQVPQLPACG